MLAACALAGTGCGDDGGSGGGRTKLTIALLPISDVAPVHLGLKKGFFREQNLDLRIQTAQGGPEIVPAVISGSVQVGYSSTPSLMSAAVKGLPIQIVAPAGRTPLTKKGNGENLLEAVMVKKDSPVRTAKDLEGRTLAVNALKNIADVTTSAALEKHGADHTKVKYLEVPLPEMLVALDAGRVDAVFTVSPFKTLAEQSGKYRTVLNPMFETRPGQVNTAYFVSKRWADRNGAVLGRFLTALRRSMEYSATHDAELRQTLLEYTKVPKPLVSKVPLGPRAPDCKELVATSKFLAALMVRYGALTRSPDFATFIRPGFCGA
jgi:NitT/TauT family transport system substrate-binding protein